MVALLATVAFFGVVPARAEPPGAPVGSTPAQLPANPFASAPPVFAVPAPGYVLVPFFPFPIPVQAPPNLMVGPGSPGARPLIPSFPYLLFVPYLPGPGAIGTAPLAAGTGTPAKQLGPTVQVPPPSPAVSEPRAEAPQAGKSEKPAVAARSRADVARAKRAARQVHSGPKARAPVAVKAKAKPKVKPKARRRKLCWKDGVLDVCR
jgi:hypothetical protein